MKRSVKAKVKRSVTRDLFGELTEGMKGLAESRHGKRTLRTRSSLDVIETENSVEPTDLHPEFARQLKIAEGIMREDRDALKRRAE